MADRPPTGRRARPPGGVITRPAGPETAGEPAGPAPGWNRHLLRFEQLLNRRRSPQLKRTTLAVALASFLAISALSFNALHGGVHFRLWAFLVLTLVATPAVLVVNAAEYRAVGAVAGRRVSLGASLRLTVLSSAANLLPLPGGVLIRTQALRQAGSTYRRALFANAAAGAAWVAMGLLSIGALFTAQDERRPAGVAMVATALAVVLGLAFALHRSCRDDTPRLLARLLAVELVTVGASAASIALGFAMLGFGIRPVQAVALAGSVIVSTAIGIFPAGLGLREALAGTIGAAVHLPAAKAVAATAAERVAQLLGMAGCAAILLFGSWRSAGAGEALAEAAADPLARSDLP